MIRPSWSKKSLILSLCIVVLFTGPAAGLTGEDSGGVLPADARYQVNVFYSSHCSACSHTMPFIRNLSELYPDVRFVYYDTADAENIYPLYTAFGEAYGHPYPSLPVVFAGDTVVLVGQESIVGNLSEVAAALESGAIPSAEYEERWMNPLYGDTGVQRETTLSIPLIMTAGLMDGINPCAFAVLVFLLITLVNVSSRRQILMVGGAYSLAIFCVYFLSGLGIFAAVQTLEIEKIFSILAATLAVVIGGLQIATAVVDGLPSFLTIPDRGRTLMAPLLRRATIPAAILLGLLVGIFELPCTGGIYIAILALLADRTTLTEGIPLLVLYNLLFVLPLVLITVIIGLGIPPERIDAWRLEHRKLLRMALGAFLVLIGIITLGAGL